MKLYRSIKIPNCFQSVTVKKSLYGVTVVRNDLKHEVSACTHFVVWSLCHIEGVQCGPLCWAAFSAFFSGYSASGAPEEETRKWNGTQAHFFHLFLSSLMESVDAPVKQEDKWLTSSASQMWVVKTSESHCMPLYVNQIPTLDLRYSKKCSHFSPFWEIINISSVFTGTTEQQIICI